MDLHLTIQREYSSEGISIAPGLFSSREMCLFIFNLIFFQGNIYGHVCVGSIYLWLIFVQLCHQPCFLGLNYFKMPNVKIIFIFILPPPDRHFHLKNP